MANVRSNRDPDVATVVVRRWENGASSGSTEEILQCLTETLPAIRNVPPYTSYIYSAHENSYVQDEVRRRLMLRDNEGELYHDSQTLDASESDSGSSSADPTSRAWATTTTARSDARGGEPRARGRRTRRREAGQGKG